VIQLKSEIISANVKICTHGKKRNWKEVMHEI
jgi:hypothetical protein